MGADDVLELAGLADDYGSGEVGLTQRQNVIVTDVPEDDLDDLLAEPLLETYSPDPHPFMRGSIACTGTEFCSLSIVETKNRMVRYARWLKGNVDVPAGVEDFHVHLSGCTASCAQPQIADISLRGMKTRKDGEPVEAFDVGLGGGLGENPQFADWVEMRVPADEVPGYVRNLLQVYEAERSERVVPEAQRGRDGDSEARSASGRASGRSPRAEAVERESFREFVAAREEAELQGLAEPEEASYEDPYMGNTKLTWYPYAEDDDMGASPAPTDVNDEPLPADD
jgi:ferredoxin-nitrite reductase